MRRFSSLGSLLDLDIVRGDQLSQKNPDYGNRRTSVAYTPQLESNNAAGSAGRIPYIQEPEQRPSEGKRKQLMREQSASEENLSEVGKQQMDHLKVCTISESCRAYSDSQLAPVKEEEQHPTSLSVSSNTLLLKTQLRHQHRAKLSSAKLHIKSLFGQSPNTSNPNLHDAAEKQRVTERRSRMHFMRQWSQVGHNKKGRISQDVLKTWAQSLNDLLASQIGVAVFEAFLRSEFSEENLQFYLACEQYRHSSNNFSLRIRAKEICATYIQPGAPREINLDSRTRELTLQLLGAPCRTTLDKAQKRVYSLLDLDCYPRFLQSNIYLSLLEEAE